MVDRVLPACLPLGRPQAKSRRLVRADGLPDRDCDSSRRISSWSEHFQALRDNKLRTPKKIVIIWRASLAARPGSIRKYCLRKLQTTQRLLRNSARACPRRGAARSETFCILLERPGRVPRMNRWHGHGGVCHRCRHVCVARRELIERRPADQVFPHLVVNVCLS